jgi:hypothetical protein
VCIRSLHANRLHKCLLVYIELVNIVCVCVGGRLNMQSLLCKVMSFYGMQGRHKICSLPQTLEQY